MTELTDHFNENSVAEIIESAKVVGMIILLRKFIPLLLDEKFEISTFLDAFGWYLQSQDFSDELVKKIQEACAEAVKIERQRKESESQQKK